MSFSQLSPLFQNIPPSTASLPEAALNNLSLDFFSADTYIIARVLKYLCFAVTALSLLLFFAGYFGAKLVALECLALVQLTALLVLTL